MTVTKSWAMGQGGITQVPNV